MPKDPEGLKLWRALRDQWQETNQKAVAARAELVRKQIACAAGTGPDPTVAEIEEVDQQERMAGRLAVEMDNFITNRLS